MQEPEPPLRPMRRSPACPLTMRPARIFLTEQELPISFGKPRRAELREKLADGSIVLTPAHRPEPEELTRLEDESSRALVQELCELLGSVTGQTVGPDTQLLQELGVDSLTYYNIFSAVSERYGISLTMDAEHPLFTARDFAAAVPGGAGGGRMKLLFRWINKLLCGWNVGLYFRPRIRYEGKKCLPAFTRGPAIIITNHKNQMDFLLVLYLFYFRYVRCLVGKTFYECNRFLNWCLRMLGAIKVDRFSFGMDFFCESVEALRRGQLLLIFPEGRFSTTGEILEFRSTAALLALQTDVPIIPMWHSVNYGFGKRTDVVIGEPIRLSELCSTANPTRRSWTGLTAILRDKVIELRGMAQEA